MRCPYCHSMDQDRVIDSRPVEGGESIRRRRICEHCTRRFTTYERVEDTIRLTVAKKDGTRVPFDRKLILEGVQKACYKRPVPAEAIVKIADAVEEEVARLPSREVPSSVIGELVMKYLRATDPIAYVRFASVYRQFKDIGELMSEAQNIMDHPPNNDPYQNNLF
ncbi:MAG: transcriptional repressor NrdR [Phycisphaerales bacterium]|nr:transcriptional repressor NrdR [Phycisphaerales bacterium]